MAERVAKGRGDDLIVLQRIHRLDQALRQQRDAAGANLGQRELEQIVGAGGAGVELAVDAVNARGDQRGGDQIRVGAGIGQAPLEAAGQGAHKRGAVVRAVRHVSRRPSRAGDRLAHHEALVAVDRWRSDGAERGRVRQHAGDEMRQQPIGRRMRAFPQRRVHVHAAAGLVGKGLGHHREDHAVRLSQGLRGELEEHEVVGTAQRIGVHEVELELAVRVFMVDLKNVEPAGCEPIAQGLQELALARQALQVV